MTFKSLFSGENGKKILIIGAAAVMILLLLSTVPRGKSTAAVQNNTAADEAETAAEIEKKLEQRLEELIGKIDGAGSVSVMVTLDSSSRKLYEKDEKTDVKGGSESGTGNTARETETVLAGSAKEPLGVGTVLPKVRGAAVVCSGAGDPVVREKVTHTVAKALNIGLSKVYVTD